MTYVITERCIDVKDGACVEVCPVDCIHTSDDDRMLYIDPVECIDCGACVDPCPVDAIYAEEDVPADQQAYTGINRLYFQDSAAARRQIDEFHPQTGAEVHLSTTCPPRRSEPAAATGMGAAPSRS